MHSGTICVTPSAPKTRPTKHRPLRAAGLWSGRRGSNPRPTAWKAVTLPLSYSRLRASTAPCFGASAAKPAWTPTRCPTYPFHFAARHALQLQAERRRAPARRPKQAEERSPLPTNLLHPARRPSARQRKKVGGEGRVRTSVATRTADLQSAAIDRSATSPKLRTVRAMSVLASSSTRCN